MNPSLTLGKKTLIFVCLAMEIRKRKGEKERM
jgi:hypothetical protein